MGVMDLKKHYFIAILVLMMFTISACTMKKENMDNSLSAQSDDNTVTHANSSQEESSVSNIDTDNIIDGFALTEDLNRTICQLACTYDDFDSNTTVNDSSWKEIFISHFIQNSRYTFTYLYTLIENGSSVISPDELQYIQESLTGKTISFDTSIDTNDAASFLSHGEISDYSYEVDNDKVRLTADYSIYFDGNETPYEYDLSVVLVSNPNSCFDGYSIEELSKIQKPTDDTNEMDLYEGEYNDYDVNEPSLEIKKNNDETYQIQIGIYRLCFLDDGMGKATDEGLEFVATAPSGKEANGLITIEKDIATVTFEGQEWLDFAGLSEFKFYKTSSEPNIYVSDAEVDSNSDEFDQTQDMK